MEEFKIKKEIINGVTCINAAELYALIFKDSRRKTKIASSKIKGWLERMKEIGNFDFIQIKGFTPDTHRPCKQYFISVDFAEKIAKCYGYKRIFENEVKQDLPKLPVIPQIDEKAPEEETIPIIEPKPSTAFSEPITDDSKPHEEPPVDWKKMYDELSEKSQRAIAFMNAVSCSEDCITVGALSKILMQDGFETMTERNLFKWFRDHDYITEEDYIRNIPTEKAILSGYMTVREVIINASGSKPHLSFTPKITGKGQIYFINFFHAMRETANESN